MDLESLNRRIVACRRCPRLVDWRETVARTKRRAYFDSTYWGKPVPGFGDERAKVLVVGLAPGAHGSNRTGRQFTGDASGAFLYAALKRAGFSNRLEAVSRDDGLRLRGLYLTASCRCVPPANKPTPEELANCRPFLESEINLLSPKVIVCLGHIAFRGILKILGLRPGRFPFGHGLHYAVRGGSGETRWLLCSYHPSQQNTLTGRLTASMFDEVWSTARELAQHDRVP